MKQENYWPENEEFHFPYRGKDFCVQIFYSATLRGYKGKILSMNFPFLLSETLLFEDVFDAIMAAIDIINRKKIITNLIKFC